MNPIKVHKEDPILTWDKQSNFYAFIKVILSLSIEKSLKLNGNRGLIFCVNGFKKFSTFIRIESYGRYDKIEIKFEGWKLMR